MTDAIGVVDQIGPPRRKASNALFGLATPDWLALALVALFAFLGFQAQGLDGLLIGAGAGLVLGFLAKHLGLGG